jgi:hypothetical protein
MAMNMRLFLFLSLVAAEHAMNADARKVAPRGRQKP